MQFCIKHAHTSKHRKRFYVVPRFAMVVLYHVLSLNVFLSLLVARALIEILSRCSDKIDIKYPGKLSGGLVCNWIDLENPITTIAWSIGFKVDDVTPG